MINNSEIKICERCGSHLTNGESHREEYECFRHLKLRAEKAEESRFSNRYFLEKLSAWRVGRVGFVYVSSYPKTGDLTDKDLAKLTINFRYRFGKQFDLLIRCLADPSRQGAREIWIVRNINEGSPNLEENLLTEEVNQMELFVDGYLSACRAKPRKKA